MTYKINDILYTKDGRKAGNLTVVAVEPTKLFDNSLTTYNVYICMSDYGNKVRSAFAEPAFSKQFFKTPGKATQSHKFYNYKEQYPEEFI